MTTLNTPPKLIGYGGRMWTLKELAGYGGIDRRTLQSRLERGMPIDEALRTPRRAYPDGVRRPRPVRPRPIAEVQRDIPACQRCGDTSYVVPFAGVERLCRRCREGAVAWLRAWVARRC